MLRVVNEYLPNHLHIVWRPSCKDSFDARLFVLELKLRPDTFNRVVLRGIRRVEYHLDLIL